MTDARATLLTLTVALAMAAVFAGASLWPGPVRPPVVSLALAGALLALAWFDIRHMILPDLITLPLIGLGFLWTWWSGGSWALSLAGAAIGYGLVRAIIWIWETRFQKDGMGLGDGKLLAAAGAWLGALALPPVLLVASGSALLTIFIVGRGKLPSRETQIRFGPFIALGFWAAWLLPLVPEL